MTHLHASQIEQGRTILLVILPPLAPGGHGVEDDGDPVEGGVAADEPGAVGDGLPAQLPQLLGIVIFSSSSNSRVFLRSAL